jgi:hypothetical protein
MTTEPKLREIAERIAAHLQRIELAHPRRGKSDCLYYSANAWPAGARLGVRYVTYQNTSNLTKRDALEYLAWLDAGNEGRHYTALSFNTRIRRETQR